MSEWACDIPVVSSCRARIARVRGGGWRHGDVTVRWHGVVEVEDGGYEVLLCCTRKGIRDWQVASRDR
jgi:hypothetical protein